VRAAIVVVAVLTGCAPHIAPYQAKHRKFDPSAYGDAPPASESSLWRRGQAGFYDDDRARRVGDIVIVKIDESDQAVRDDSTKLTRDSKAEVGMPGAGVLAALFAKMPDLDPAALFGSESSESFAGGGTIQRKGKLSATLPVRVREVLPNGDLFVEGTKVVMIGREEQHLYLSGIVRPADISADDVVRSSRIAEAEIELVGRGDVSDQQRPGWLRRILSKLNPF
jgi:flagellar L-ring protein precursor FlgH